MAGLYAAMVVPSRLIAVRQSAKAGRRGVEPATTVSE
jgi:hypothetical protein